MQIVIGMYAVIDIARVVDAGATTPKMFGKLREPAIRILIDNSGDLLLFLPGECEKSCQAFRSTESRSRNGQCAFISFDLTEFIFTR